MTGDVIRELRKRKGLTMKELGQAIGGIAESTIGMYETNRRIPEHETLEKLSRYFQVPTQHLLEQGIYAKKDFVLSHMDMILNIMERDYGKANTQGDFINFLRSLDTETQFKAISAFLLDANYDEDSNEIQLIYYI